MVVVIRVPGMAHQGLEDVWEYFVKPKIRFGEDAIIVNVIMKEKGKGSAVPGCHKPVKNGMGIAKRVVEVESTGE